MALSDGMTPADVAALTNNDGFGGNGAWWIIILFLFAFMGGGFGRNDAQTVQNGYTLSSDFATLQRQLSDGFSTVERRTDSIVNGICELGYTQQGLINGVNQNVSTQAYNTLAAIAQNGYEGQLATQALATQLGNCCCETTQAINTGVRDIIENQNCNYRAIHDEIVANRIEDKNAQIQAQAAKIAQLELTASQVAQTNDIVSRVRPCPIPAYTVANPYCGYYGTTIG